MVSRYPALTFRCSTGSKTTFLSMCLMTVFQCHIPSVLNSLKIRSFGSSVKDVTCWCHWLLFRALKGCKEPNVCYIKCSMSIPITLALNQWICCCLFFLFFLHPLWFFSDSLSLRRIKTWARWASASDSMGGVAAEHGFPSSNRLKMWSKLWDVGQVGVAIVKVV